MEFVKSDKRNRDSEQELAAHRTLLVPRQKSTIGQKLRGLSQFVLAYWPLLSFLAGIALILYVQLAFQVDYFESYRSIATSRKLADFYRQLGDEMLEKREWEAAATAYQSALDLDKNNTDAVYGIAKAEVFQPLKNQKYWAPEVVDAKLAFLLARYPNDYQLYFLKAERFLGVGDYKDAEAWLLKSLEINPRFAGAYMMLGYIRQGQSDILAARTNYEKALALEPENATALNNLGFVEILALDFDSAIKHLNDSRSMSDNLLTALNLGDAYRYQRDFTRASKVHSNLLEVLADPGNYNERFLAGLWTYNYMPLRRGDVESIKKRVFVSTLRDKRVFVLYALSFDYALLGNFDQANKNFDAAVQGDPTGYYNGFFVNKIASIQSLISKDSNAQRWFQLHQAMLAPK